MNGIACLHSARLNRNSWHGHVCAFRVVKLRVILLVMVLYMAEQALGVNTFSVCEGSVCECPDSDTCQFLGTQSYKLRNGHLICPRTGEDCLLRCEMFETCINSKVYVFGGRLDIYCANLDDSCKNLNIIAEDSTNPSVSIECQEFSTVGNCENINFTQIHTGPGSLLVDIKCNDADACSNFVFPPFDGSTYIRNKATPITGTSTCPQNEWACGTFSSCQASCPAVYTVFGYESLAPTFTYSPSKSTNNPTSHPATLAPVTSHPVTLAPLTSHPATLCPVTFHPVTSIPVTSHPSTTAPLTSHPVTLNPVTAHPVTQAPVTSNPLTLTPVTAHPVTQAPVTSNPLTLTPVTSHPVTLAPVTLHPVTWCPVTSHPATLAPLTSHPLTLHPVTSHPVTLAPATSHPLTLDPLTSHPATMVPLTAHPVSIAPSSLHPISSSPVTEHPVTLSPTTTSPSTRSPSTCHPNTGSPTTYHPLTTHPTTDSPVTDNPVTVSPSTCSPVSFHPVTSSPKTLNPVTSQPLTFNPVTRSPSTFGPATYSPSTCNPTSERPSTQNPQTLTPSSAHPATSIPFTNHPTTSTPLTSAPITHVPLTSTPLTSTPITSTPITSTPLTSTPLTSTPLTSTPLTSTPLTSAPVSIHPSSSSPFSVHPASSTPLTNQPFTATPITGNPATSNPLTKQPSTSTPVTNHPATQGPGSLAPTSAHPFTSHPTTYNPITNLPTTLAPSPSPGTLHPATCHPATIHPGTASPLSSHPITLHPVSLHPTTLHPVSLHPLSLHPLSSHPVSLSPGTFGPSTFAPLTSHPVSLHPTTFNPVSLHPVTLHPASFHPVTFNPMSLHPATTQPVTSAPIMAPTSLFPSFPNPSSTHTTIVANTEAPVTPMPSILPSASPSTLSPTTSPMSESPMTSSPSLSILTVVVQRKHLMLKEDFPPWGPDTSYVPDSTDRFFIQNMEKGRMVRVQCQPDTEKVSLFHEIFSDDASSTKQRSSTITIGDDDPTHWECVPNGIPGRVSIRCNDGDTRYVNVPRPRECRMPYLSYQSNIPRRFSCPHPCFEDTTAQGGCYGSGGMSSVGVFYVRGEFDGNSTTPTAFTVTCSVERVDFGQFSGFQVGGTLDNVIWPQLTDFLISYNGGYLSSGNEQLSLTVTSATPMLAIGRTDSFLDPFDPNACPLVYVGSHLAQNISCSKHNVSFITPYYRDMCGDRDRCGYFPLEIQNPDIAGKAAGGVLRCPPGCPRPGLGIFYTPECTGYTSTVACSAAAAQGNTDGLDCAWGARDDCRLCNPNGLCPGGYRLWPRIGYYAHNERVQELTVCPRPTTERCRGWDISKGSTKCGDPYTGILCASCAGGYYERLGECLQCPTGGMRSRGRKLFMLILVLSTLFVLIALSTRIAYCSASAQIRSIGIYQAKDFVFWSFIVLQVHGLVLSSASGLTSEVKILFSWLNIVNFEFEAVGPECLRSGWPPFIFETAIISFTLFIGFINIVILNQTCLKRLIGDSIVASIRILLFRLLTVLYTPATFVSLCLIHCKSIPDENGGSIVVSSHNKNYVCYGKEHMQPAVLALLTIAAFSLGYPIWTFYVLKKIKKNFQDISDDDNPSTPTLVKRHRNDEQWKLYRFFFGDDYFPRYFWALHVHFVVVWSLCCTIVFGRDPTDNAQGVKVMVNVVVVLGEILFLLLCSPYMPHVAWKAWTKVSILLVVCLNSILDFVNFLHSTNRAARATVVILSNVVFIGAIVNIVVLLTAFYLIVLRTSSWKRRMRTHFLIHTGTCRKGIQRNFSLDAKSFANAKSDIETKPENSEMKLGKLGMESVSRIAPFNSTLRRSSIPIHVINGLNSSAKGVNLESLNRSSVRLESMVNLDSSASERPRASTYDASAASTATPNRLGSPQATRFRGRGRSVKPTKTQTKARNITSRIRSTSRPRIISRHVSSPKFAGIVDFSPDSKSGSPNLSLRVGKGNFSNNHRIETPPFQMQNARVFDRIKFRTSDTSSCPTPVNSIDGDKKALSSPNRAEVVTSDAASGATSMAATPVTRRLGSKESHTFSVASSRAILDI